MRGHSQGGFLEKAGLPVDFVEEGIQMRNAVRGCPASLLGMRSLPPQLLAMLRGDGLQLTAPWALPQLKTLPHSRSHLLPQEAHAQ